MAGLATENNHRLFRRYTKVFAENNPHEYSLYAHKFATWLGDSKAYYTAARPEIIRLLLVAQITVRGALGVSANLSVPFNVFQHPPHPLVQPYVHLVQAILPYEQLFLEPSLAAHVNALRATIYPASQSITSIHNPQVLPSQPLSSASGQTPISGNHHFQVASDRPHIKTPALFFDPDIQIIETPNAVGASISSPQASTSSTVMDPAQAPVKTKKVKKRKTFDFNALAQADVNALLQKKESQSALPKLKVEPPSDAELLSSQAPRLDASNLIRNEGGSTNAVNAPHASGSMAPPALPISPADRPAQASVESLARSPVVTAPSPRVPEPQAQARRAEISMVKSPVVQSPPKSREPQVQIEAAVHESILKPVQPQTSVEPSAKGAVPVANESLQSMDTDTSMEIAENIAEFSQAPPEINVATHIQEITGSKRSYPAVVPSAVLSLSVDAPMEVDSAMQIQSEPQASAQPMDVDDQPRDILESDCDWGDFGARQHADSNQDEIMKSSVSLAPGAAEPQLQAPASVAAKEMPSLRASLPADGSALQTSPPPPPSSSLAVPSIERAADAQRDLSMPMSISPAPPASVHRSASPKDAGMNQNATTGDHDMVDENIPAPVQDPQGPQPSASAPIPASPAAAVNTPLSGEPTIAAQPSIPAQEMSTPQANSSQKNIFSGDGVAIIAIQPGPKKSSKIRVDFVIPAEMFVGVGIWLARNRKDPQIPLQQISDAGVCLSLGCYLKSELDGLSKTDGYTTMEAKISEIPSVWPTNGDMTMNAKFEGNREDLPLAPPFHVTPDNFVDVSLFVNEGGNYIELCHLQDLSKYTFVLHCHHPTRAQIKEIEDRRRKDEEWAAWLQDLTKPLNIPMNPLASKG